MGVYEKKVKKDKKEIIEKAKTFFGPGGLALTIASDDECCITFEGGGGHVTVTLTEQEGSPETTVEVQTREWDFQAKKFLQII
jgi:hypothetical protein